MKKLNHLAQFIAITLLGIFAFACTNEEADNSNSSNSSLHRHNKSVMGVEDIDTTQINPAALEYYTLIKDIILMTKSNTLEKANDVSLADIPTIEKLKELDISDTNGNKISFYDLNQDQQVKFLNEWVIIQASDLTDKVEQANVKFDDYLKEHNKRVKEVIDNCRTYNQNGIYEITDIQGFFNSLEQNLNREAYESATDTLHKIGGIFDEAEEAPSSTLKQSLKLYGRRGDFMLALPAFGCPYVLWNTSNDRFQVGHAGVITKHVTDVNVVNDTLSIETWNDNKGVQYKKISSWNVKCYIMGVQKVKWEWRWRGFKSGWYKVTTPVSNPWKLADRAEQCKGRPYCDWYDFLTSKWAAPAKFTCTTLVWYSASKEYDINILPWYSIWVTPSHLFTDESTYIRAIITQ